MMSPACSDRRRPGRRPGRVASSAVALAIAVVLVAAPVRAADPFVVRDIRVEGAQAVTALYATGFFRDARITAPGDILVVSV